MEFERGKDIVEEGEEIKTYLKEEEEEWGFVRETGEKEILKNLGQQIMIYDKQLSERISDWKNFLEKYQEVENMTSTQKAKIILLLNDSMINALLSERRYLRSLLKQREIKAAKEIITSLQKEETIRELKDATREKIAKEVRRSPEMQEKMYHARLQGASFGKIAKDFILPKATVFLIIKNMEKKLGKIEKKKKVEEKESDVHNNDVQREKNSSEERNNVPKEQ